MKHIFIRFLFEQIRRHKKAYALFFVMMLVLETSANLTPYFLRLISDNMQNFQSIYFVSVIGWLIVNYFLFHTFQSVSLFSARYVASNLALPREKEIRELLLVKLFKCSGNFYNKYPSGDLLTRFTEDSEYIYWGLTNVLYLSTSLVLSVTLILGFMFNLSTVLTFWVLGLVLAFPLLSRTFQKRMVPLFRQEKKWLGKLSNFTKESMVAIVLLKNFNAIHGFWMKFNELLEGHLQIRLQINKNSSFFMPSMELFSGLAVVVVVGVGGYQQILGNLSLGEFVAFEQYSLRLFFAFLRLGFVMWMVGQAKVSLERVYDILNYVDDVYDNSIEPKLKSTFPLNQHLPTLTFSQLSFKYPPSSLHDFSDFQLQNISFSIKAGEKIALVGEVGSGKTTLLNLITRYYQVSSKMIMIDDIDLVDYPISQLRSWMAYVRQESYIFKGTVLQNMELGLSGGLDEVTAWEILRMVELEDQVRGFTHGLQEVIGERGITLSGGQKQRLAIARAFAVSPKFLILDDALSALDADTEAKLIQNIKNNSVDMSMIIVTHRLPSVIGLDKIAVLSQGRMVDFAKHDILLARCIDYQQIYKKFVIKEGL